MPCGLFAGIIEMNQYDYQEKIRRHLFKPPEAVLGEC